MLVVLKLIALLTLLQPVGHLPHPVHQLAANVMPVQHRHVPTITQVVLEPALIERLSVVAMEIGVVVFLMLAA
jgi:hypothetical protein